MPTRFCHIAAAVALCLVASAAIATPQQDDGQWHGDQHGQYNQGQKPDWQRRVEHQEAQQRQQERNQEWQRQQQEQQRQQGEWQQRRNEAWQRQQEADLRQRAADQRRHDEAWQRQQESIINHQAGYRVYDSARHRGHDHRWERGHRYDGPIHVVNDYRDYRLREPPRGYRWVRADNSDYLLVAIATGVILDIATH